jgi:hypothetical protein
MGAVSFQNVEPLRYDYLCYHDYHGCRATKTDCRAAFNAFTAPLNQRLLAVSFFTAADDVNYTVKVYGRFENGELLDELVVKSGTIAHTGFHTIDLDTPVTLIAGDGFCIYLDLSAGGQPYDCSADIPVLLGSSQRVWVDSTAQPGESYYRDGSAWQDLYDLNQTANFCIKGLAVRALPDRPGDLNCDGQVNERDINPFVLALSKPAVYQAQYPYCTLLNADCNADGAVDFGDINPFVALLSG